MNVKKNPFYYINTSVFLVLAVYSLLFCIQVFEPENIDMNAGLCAVIVSMILCVIMYLVHATNVRKMLASNPILKTSLEIISVLIFLTLSCVVRVYMMGEFELDLTREGIVLLCMFMAYLTARMLNQFGFATLMFLVPWPYLISTYGYDMQDLTRMAAVIGGICVLSLILFVVRKKPNLKLAAIVLFLIAVVAYFFYEMHQAGLTSIYMENYRKYIECFDKMFEFTTFEKYYYIALVMGAIIGGIRLFLGPGSADTLILFIVNVLCFFTITFDLGPMYLHFMYPLLAMAASGSFGTRPSYEDQEVQLKDNLENVQVKYNKKDVVGVTYVDDSELDKMLEDIEKDQRYISHKNFSTASQGEDEEEIPVELSMYDSALSRPDEENTTGNVSPSAPQPTPAAPPPVYEPVRPTTPEPVAPPVYEPVRPVTPEPTAPPPVYEPVRPTAPEPIAPPPVYEPVRPVAPEPIAPQPVYEPVRPTTPEPIMPTPTYQTAAPEPTYESVMAAPSYETYETIERQLEVSAYEPVHYEEERPAYEPEYHYEEEKPAYEPEYRYEEQPVMQPVFMEPEPVIEPQPIVTPEPVMEQAVSPIYETVAEQQQPQQPEAFAYEPEYRYEEEKPAYEPEYHYEEEKPAYEPEYRYEEEKPAYEPEYRYEAEQPAIEPQSILSEPESIVEAEPVMQPVFMEPEPVVEPQPVVEQTVSPIYEVVEEQPEISAYEPEYHYEEEKPAYEPEYHYEEEKPAYEPEYRYEAEQPAIEPQAEVQPILSEPEPIVEAEPVMQPVFIEPEPVIEPQPEVQPMMSEPEPVVEAEPEPVIEPQPVVKSEPVIEPQPVMTPQPVTEQAVSPVYEAVEKKAEEPQNLQPQAAIATPAFENESKEEIPQVNKEPEAEQSKPMFETMSSFFANNLSGGNAPRFEMSQQDAQSFTAYTAADELYTPIDSLEGLFVRADAGAEEAGNTAALEKPYNEDDELVEEPVSFHRNEANNVLNVSAAKPVSQPAAQQPVVEPETVDLGLDLGEDFSFGQAVSFTDFYDTDNTSVFAGFEEPEEVQQPVVPEFTAEAPVMEAPVMETYVAEPQSTYVTEPQSTYEAAPIMQESAAYTAEDVSMPVTTPVREEAATPNVTAAVQENMAIPNVTVAIQENTAIPNVMETVIPEPVAVAQMPEPAAEPVPVQPMPAVEEPKPEPVVAKKEEKPVNPFAKEADFFDWSTYDGGDLEETQPMAEESGNEPVKPQEENGFEVFVWTDEMVKQFGDTAKEAAPQADKTFVEEPVTEAIQEIAATAVPEAVFEPAVNVSVREEIPTAPVQRTPVETPTAPVQRTPVEAPTAPIQRNPVEAPAASVQNAPLREEPAAALMEEETPQYQVFQSSGNFRVEEPEENEEEVPQYQVFQSSGNFRVEEPEEETEAAPQYQVFQSSGSFRLEEEEEEVAPTLVTYGGPEQQRTEPVTPKPSSVNRFDDLEFDLDLPDFEPFDATKR
ncbi:MAG: hypothetical protein NC086_07865 [Alistipes sp.]|nr:hypothetical protein [Alistipes sp.]